MQVEINQRNKLTTNEWQLTANESEFELFFAIGVNPDGALAMLHSDDLSKENIIDALEEILQDLKNPQPVQPATTEGTDQQSETTDAPQQ